MLEEPQAWKAALHPVVPMSAAHKKSDRRQMARGGVRVLPAAPADILLPREAVPSELIIKTSTGRVSTKASTIEALTAEGMVVIELLAGSIVLHDADVLKTPAAPAEPGYRTYSEEEILSARAAELFDSLAD